MSVAIATARPWPSGRSGPAAVALALAVVFAILSAHLVWVGYLESDDLFYAKAAQAWLQHGWFLGTTHWAIRHVIVLPMAAGFRIFGPSEATLLLPSQIYTVATLALLAYIAYRLHGVWASAFVVAIAGSIPVVATGASNVSTDLPEAFFVIASIWTLHQACAHARVGLFVLSGALAGCALITRETTAALLVFFGIVAVTGYGGRRSRYAWLAVGLAAIVGVDWLYLTALSGDPLYRLHVALAGAHNDGPQMEALFSKAPGVDRFGSLDVARWIKPEVTLLLNQNFALFFWFAVPATIWMGLRGAPPARRAARLLGGAALTWFVVLGYLLAPWLWVIPRYFMVCIVLTVPLAGLLAEAVPVRRLWAVTALVVLLAANTAFNLGATTDLMAGERALVTVAQTSPEIVHTDPATARGAAWLLALDGLSDRVSTTPPAPGALFFFNSRPRRPWPDDWSLRSPAADWVRLRAFSVPPKWTGWLVSAFGLSRLLPSGLVDKLAPPPHVIATYRVPAP